MFKLLRNYELVSEQLYHFKFPLVIVGIHVVLYPQQHLAFSAF